MNRTLILLSALSAGLTTAATSAQAAPAQTAAPPTPTAATAVAPKPEAIPAKIALISFEQAVFATNEGQRAVQDVQKKYEPKKAQIDTLAQEVDTLKKQMQSAPSTTTDEDRASRLRAIDIKEKALNRDAEEASQAYQADLQEAYGKVAQKVNVTMRQYVEQSGYTLLLDVSGQQSPVMWATSKANTDVSQAVIDAYNASSGVAAPPPTAPSAARPRATTPRPGTPAPSGTSPKK